MEYTQWVVAQFRDNEDASVLILVVMEYTQWGVNILPKDNYVSLNPCCNGIYSMSFN